MSLRLRQASHCLALLLLPALAPGFSRAVPRPRTTPGPEAAIQTRHLPQPYLRVVGAPPLRFVEVTPPADPITRMPPPGTPVAPTDNPTAELEPSTEATADVSTEPGVATEVAETMPAARPLPTTVVPATRVEPEPASRGPAPILPDDTRPSLQPEDFLPFFQLPGTGGLSGEVNVITRMPAQAPAPPALPPSSAIYRQTP